MNLDNRVLQQWKRRFDRCPWGPKADAERHYQLCALQASGDIDMNIFKLDKTMAVKDEIRKFFWTDEEEAIKSEGDHQVVSDMLLNLKTKLGV